MTTYEPQSCFVAMPITVPDHLLERYEGRDNHFVRIHECLIQPAIEKAGLEPSGPARAGTENIQAAIINDLKDADLVLADLSALNPNVFLELGLRSALDGPICLVWDGFDRLPFDSGTLNTHRYAAKPIYDLNSEIERMAEHIAATVERCEGRNELWKYFGSAAMTLPIAELDPDDASIHSKLDRLISVVEAEVAGKPQRPVPTDEEIAEVVQAVQEALGEAGEAGMHGSLVRRIAMTALGEKYDGFLGGRSLSARLQGSGVQVATDSSGNFFLRSSRA